MTVWAALLLPLAGALVLTVVGGGLGRRAHGAIAAGAIGLSFLAFLSMAAAHVPVGTTAVLGPWLPLPGADLALTVDAYAMALALMVTGISAAIAVYSIGYLGHDGGTQRYFAALDLFVFAMLLIVLAANYVLLFAGWELVGVCSYLLIGHWRERPAAAAAAMKAFLVNRVGDAAFLVGMFGILVHYQTLAIQPERLLSAGPAPLLPYFLLLAGALAKSAQLPLHIWLPDAMEGPTPVSALIHAATMVTAGVVLLLRVPFPGEILAAAAVIGSVTALFAAVVALAQTDLKRVLAWSTISQIGLMFVGAGVGAAFATLFHLLSHAFFKSTLFLGAGSVLHATDDELDLRRLGGLGARLRWTTPAFAVGTLGLAAIPPASGFFSKEAIAAALADRPLLLAALLATSVLTALYATRLFAAVFVAPASSPQATGARESPPLMLVPLGVLAAGALIFGASIAMGVVTLGFPGQREPSLGLAATSVVLAVGGAAIGWARYRHGLSDEVLPSGVRRFAAHGFGVDAVLVRFSARLAATIAYAFELAFERLLERGVDVFGRIAVVGSAVARRSQTGFLRQYETLLLAGAVALLGYWTIGGFR